MEDWFLGQVTGILRRRGVRICRQTIYNHVHADPTGRLAALPHVLEYTRRAKSLGPTEAANIKDRTSIHLRFAEANGRRFGDWEMDTIVDGYAILTLTERSTTFLLMQ